MPCLTETTEFQARLVAAYQGGGLVPDDLLIHAAATRPGAVLSAKRNIVERLIFALEKYAAFCGQPHPCLHNVEVNYMWWPRERWIESLEQDALNALFQVTQSPFGAEFANDVHQLRPRLLRTLAKAAV